jgi:hypothetical protein
MSNDSSMEYRRSTVHTFSGHILTRSLVERNFEPVRSTSPRVLNLSRYLSDVSVRPDMGMMGCGATSPHFVGRHARLVCCCCGAASMIGAREMEGGVRE